MRRSRPGASHFISSGILLDRRSDARAPDLASGVVLGRRFLDAVLQRIENLEIQELIAEFPVERGLAKPLFHYLDTAVYNRDRFEIGLKRLGNHIGQTTRYAPSHAKRLLDPFLHQFVDIGFLHSYEFKPSRSKKDPVKLIIFPGERARRRGSMAVSVSDEGRVRSESGQRKVQPQAEVRAERQVGTQYHEIELGAVIQRFVLEGRLVARNEVGGIGDPFPRSQIGQQRGLIRSGVTAGRCVSTP